MINASPEQQFCSSKMYLCLILLVLCGWVSPRPDSSPVELDNLQMHPDIHTTTIKARAGINPDELHSEFWNSNAQDIIREKLLKKNNENVAKNVILFLGDGMSVPTLAGTRAYMGGEEMQLSFDKLPHTALSKTYCVDAQTADSACTATAYLGGVKNNIGTIGVTAAVVKDDCEAMLLEENQVQSIAKWSQDAGKRTGIVTTSTITDASPSGAFAYIANRNWQSDTDILKLGLNSTRCRDIAYQLVKWDTGKKFNVILGGGSNVFIPTGSTDPLGSRGSRSDGVNLIDEWLADRKAEGNGAEYIWNRTGLLNLADNTDYVLGLFNGGYIPYNLERDPALTPSLEELTEAAIKIASKGNGADNGFFLFIEGGRIDHGHHANWARKAFDETIEFSKAINKALELTSEEDTLIVVTSDHAHTMTISGYPDRYNDILGVAGTDDFGVGRTTINYANGPGFLQAPHDYSIDDKSDKDFRFPSVTKLGSETHGGDDVGIFASGPWSHLYSGVLEQNTIPHIMAFASCVGRGETACSGAFQTLANLSLPIILGALLSFFYL